MRRRWAVLFAVLTLGMHALLLTGLVAFAPPMLRVVRALSVLVLGPGLAWISFGASFRRTSGPSVGTVPAGGWWLAPAWALGFGVAWNALLVLATRALGVPFTVLTMWALPANAVLWAVAIARASAPPAPPAAHAPPAPSLASHRVALAGVLLAAAIGALHAGRIGTPITYYSDSPDHIGTVRRMMEHGDAFPVDAFFKDAGPGGADPRKGLWHPQVALIAKLAGVDAVEAWRDLPVVLTPLFVLEAAAFGFLVGGPVAAAVGAWALLLTYGGSLGAQPIRETVFATKLSDQLALATAVALLADLSTLTWASRLAVLGLGLAAVFTHVYAVIQFAIAFGALGLGLVVRDHGVSLPVRRLVATGALLATAALPYLVWRAGFSYHPTNVIHTEPQGLLLLWDGARIVSVGILWDWMGKAWILFPLSWWALWRYGRNTTAALYVLTTSLAVTLLLFVPPVVAVLQPRLGYLLMRMLWMVPLYGLLAWLVPALARAVGSSAGPARARAALALAFVGVVLVPDFGDAVRAVLHPGAIAAGEAAESPLAWRPELAWMDAHLPPGRVVLSDPATSYGVPMLTRHYVVTLVDQHSSPNDSLALRRILDARDALDPNGTWERTRAVIARWGADVIVLNRRFPDVPHLDYWAPSPGWFDAARARLDAHPEAFARVLDHHDFVVYQVRSAGLAGLHGGTPRAIVTPYLPGLSGVATRMGDDVPALQRFSLWPHVARPGDTLRGVIDWRAIQPLPAGSYTVAVRFDRNLPGGFRPPAAFAKPARKLLERLRGERYRFRADHLPAAGEFGVDLWRPGEVVRDSFTLEVPRDVADGTYDVGVKIMRHPHYPILHLSDYFRDDDYFTGVRVGTAIVARSGIAPATGGRPSEGH